MESSLVRHLNTLAQDRVALLDIHGSSLTYADLLDAIAHMGGWLSRANIGAGDVVAVVGSEPLSLLQCFLATMETAICAPLYPQASRQELQQLLFAGSC